MKKLVFKCTEIPRAPAIIPGARQISYPRGARTVHVAGLGGRYDRIIFYGSHGQFRDGRPTVLNGLEYDTAELLVGRLLSLRVMADTIVLDCCFSVGFIPLLANLLDSRLERPGRIIGHMGSVSASLTPLLEGTSTAEPNAPLGRADVGELGAAGDLPDFVSLAVYVDGPIGQRILYRKNYDPLNRGGQCRRAVDQHASADLLDMDSYIASRGVQIRVVSTSTLMQAARRAML